MPTCLVAPSYRLTSSKRPQGVITLFMRKKDVRLKPKLPTQKQVSYYFPVPKT